MIYKRYVMKCDKCMSIGVNPDIEQEMSRKETINTALQNGWTEEGENHYCKNCSEERNATADKVQG